jgi:hypothetical protein
MTTTLWERQSGESTQAFEAFVTYRDLGDDRSHAMVAQQLGKSKTMIDRWGKRWGWQARIVAYDNYVDEKRRKALEKERLGMRERHVNLSVALQSQVAQRLNQLVQSQEILKMGPVEMAKVMEVTAKIEREARGLPGSVTEQAHSLAANDEFLRRALHDDEARTHIMALTRRLLQPEGAGAGSGASDPGGAGPDAQPGSLDLDEALGAAQ